MPRRSTFRISLPVLLGGVLLSTAIGMVVYGNAQIAPATFRGRVIDLLPGAPPGWTRLEKPVAETPEVKKAIDQVLNYNDATLVDYMRGSSRVSVYVAYWQPGRMPQRLVAGHTPDICWVATGWRDETLNFRGSLLSNPPTRLRAQSRVFSFRGHDEFVWFWHIVGNEVPPYSANEIPPWPMLFSEIWAEGFRQRHEQFFIRISSNESLGSAGVSSLVHDILLKLPVN